MATKLKKSITGVFFVVAWAMLFGEASKTLTPDNIMFEFTSVVCGASLGFIFYLVNQYLVKKLSEK